MKYLKKPYFAFIIFAYIPYSFATTSKLIPRSQSFDAARQLVGWNNPEWGINRLPEETWYTSFNALFAYTRSFRDPRISFMLFGHDLACQCNNSQDIVVVGSDVSIRGQRDWLADYFGLPRDYASAVDIHPLIDNFILDFAWYVGLDNWLPGLYFRVHGPYVNSRWSLNNKEIILSKGSVGYFQGYFSSEEVPVENLNRSFLDYMSGRTPTINNEYAQYGEYECLMSTECSPLGNIIWHPLCCGKFNDTCNGVLTANGFAELRFVLGYNFINDELGDYHLGAGIYAAAPTGTRVGDPCSKNGNYLFEPIVGNGHHWELGTQITAHHIWWRSEDDNKSFGMYFVTNITHLFDACQTRCFNLCSAGDNSRYMLAQKLESNADVFPTIPADYDTLNLQFANEYSPVANLTRRTVASKINVQADLAMSLSYQVGGLQWDVGYNFWGQSCEKLCIKNCETQSSDIWALKGDQRVYGFRNSEYDSYAFKLAVTDSDATINEGSNMQHYVSYLNENPTDPKNLWADNSTRIGPTSVTLPNGTIPIYTSETPIIIEESDFDLSGTYGISNKVFGHFNWAWAENDETAWTPYLGIGLEAEFGARTARCCTPLCRQTLFCNTAECSAKQTCIPNKNCCTNVAISQWGIWFKVGASYN